MFAITVLRRMCLLAFLLPLAACSTSGFRGASLSPVLDPADVAGSQSQQGLVISYLTLQATGSEAPLPIASKDWYLVALQGFDYIDERCDVYLAHLHQIEKSTATTKSLLGTLNSASSTLLTIFDVPNATIAVIAQLFGLGIAFNDEAAQSYLLAIGSSNAASLLNKLRAEYQDALDPASVNNRPAVVKRIREYLRICMPVYLEGKISDYLAKSGASAGNRAFGLGLESSVSQRTTGSINVELAPPGL